MKTKLSTEHLKLHLITAADFENIHHLHSIPEVDRYNTTGIPNSLDETVTLMEPFVAANEKEERYTFAIHQKEDGVFVGTTGLFLGKVHYRSAEAWYKILPEFWGKGYATEVLKELITFSLDTLKLHRLEAGCAVGNVGSIRVMEKAGMTREGRRRQTLPLVDGWSDNFDYSILDTDPRK